MVIAIMGILAAIALPSIRGIKPNAKVAGTRQLLEAVGRARQLAISQRTTVYMVFLSTNFWASVPAAPRSTNGPATIAGQAARRLRLCLFAQRGRSAGGAYIRAICPRGGPCRKGPIFPRQKFCARRPSCLTLTNMTLANTTVGHLDDPAVQHHQQHPVSRGDNPVTNAPVYAALHRF